MLLLQVIQLQASITWKQCAEIPNTDDVYGRTSTVINGKVYYGGGWRNVYGDGDDDFNVYRYDPPQDNWTTLPPLPVRYFSLGQVRGKLVAVGGKKKSSDTPTNDVFTFDERSRKWKHTIPPMPTARHSPGVLSLQSALVVAGGDTDEASAPYTDVVEIFKPDTSQWYSTDPLPTACRDISLTGGGNTCYAIGGYKQISSLNQALYASVDDLFHNAVPANQTTHNGSSETRSAWKTLPNTPSYRSTAAMLAGNLLAIGGEETSERDDKEEVYTYSPSTNSWVYFTDLPEPRYETTVAVLSPAEILVIGGRCDDRVNTVYKGTLNIVL